MGWDSYVFDFLKSRNFFLIDQDDSKSFGDYYKTFSNGIIQFRFSSAKSSESIEISSVDIHDKWYDLALVKALIYNEENLNIITSRNDYSNIVINEFDKIAQLFDSNNVISTQVKLDDIGIKRAKQMFPRNSRLIKETYNNITVVIQKISTLLKLKRYKLIPLR